MALYESEDLRAIRRGSSPAAWIPDIPPRRTLLDLNRGPGGIPGKRGEESQEEFTSSLGLPHQSVFPDRAVAPPLNAPPSRFQPVPPDPGAMPRPSEVNTSG